MKSLQDSAVAIVGLGLMGGSLALALRAQYACRKIIGITRDDRTCQAALARGCVDAVGAELDLATAADVIVLATPVRTILAQLPLVGTMACEGAIVMDLGSTKREITRAMQDLPGYLEPIGAHPMCGKEGSGFNFADADLYHNAVFVLTPLERTSPQTLAFAQSFAVTLGARPVTLDAVQHDRIVAAISHLPFALATSLMTTVEELTRDGDRPYTLAASGFRDTSRLAASDTTMMLDILMTNRENVAAATRACAQHLDELADLIAAADEPALYALLQNAAAERRALKSGI